MQPDIAIGVSPLYFNLTNFQMMPTFISFHSNSLNSSAISVCKLPNGMEKGILPLEIRLSSPTFYQLGEHLMSIVGVIIDGVEFGSQLQVVVKPDISELLNEN